jgi:hypothetical protein
MELNPYQPPLDLTPRPDQPPPFVSLAMKAIAIGLLVSFLGAFLISLLFT